MSFTEDYLEDSFVDDILDDLDDDGVLYESEFDDDQAYDGEDDFDDGEEDDFDSFLGEEDDDDAFPERRRRRRRRRRRYSRPRVARNTQTKARRPSGRAYSGKGRIRTPAGTARVQLPKNLVTKAELRSTASVLARDIKKNAGAILKVNARLNSVNSRLESRTASLAKGVSANSKKLNGLQQAQLFSALLPASIEKVDLEELNSDGSINSDGVKASFKVSNVKRDSLSTLLPLMMTGSMGGGSGSSGNNNMNMMLPLLLLSKDDNGDDNDNMMIIMLMMMMNNK